MCEGLKVSVIVPVKNEEDNIRGLLDSLLNQTIIPDEIVITDGGSEDSTRSIIEKEYIDKGKCVRLLHLPDALPGKGRNNSIRNAKYNIIASIDAGCIAERKWVEELMAPFKKDDSIDVVYGACMPNPMTTLEKCFVTTTVPSNNWITVVSLAFKKEVWSKTGGFPEDIRTAEDAVFLDKIKALNINTINNYNAITYWRPRTNIYEFCRQLYEYAKGQGLMMHQYMLYFRKVLFYSYISLLILMGLHDSVIYYIMAIISYIIWISLSVIFHYKWFSGIKRVISAYYMLPLVVMARDISSIFGYCVGLFQRLFKHIYCHNGNYNG